MSKRIGITFLLIIFSISFILSGCTPPEGAQPNNDEKSGEKNLAAPGVTDDTVKIGSFMALSGAAASLGVPIQKGLESYINYVNDNGGVNGRNIELLVEDDAYDPAKAVAVTKKLVEQEEVFAIGPALGTGSVLAVKDYLLEKGVPLVHPMTGSSKVKYPPEELIFPVQPTYIDEAQILVKFGKENLNTKKIAVIYHNTDYGKEGLEGTKKGAKEQGVEIVYEGAVDGKTVDYSSHILKAKEAGADTVVIYGILNIAAGVIKEAHNQGYNPNFLTFYPNLDQNLFKLAGEDAMNKVYSTGWTPHPDKNDENYQKFVEIYQKYQGEGETPSGLATAGFIAGEIIVEGLKRAGEDLTRESFIEALETFDNFKGIQAPGISYGEGDRTGVTSLRIYKAENGTFVPVTDNISFE